MTRPLSSRLTSILALVLGICIASFGYMTLATADNTVPPATLAPAKKVVFGTVKTQDGQPVENAPVVAYGVNRPHRLSTTTAADGSYELELGPGLWAITVFPADAVNLDRLIYPHEPQIVEFENNGLPEREEVNFILVKPTSTVMGKIEMPDGSVPPFSVVIGFRNGEGIGGRTEISPTTGEFSLRLPPGRYDVFIHVKNDQYAGPHLDPIVVPPGETVDLGTITLLTRAARISGQVVDQNGVGVPNIPVIAWQGDRADIVRTRTDSSGNYTLKVFSGRWHVIPAPQPDQPYIYQGDGERVEVGPGESITGIDFKLLKLEARIVGVVVEQGSDEILDVHGWAAAVKGSDPPFRNGAPIRAGHFGIPVIAGDYEVDIELAPGTPYRSLGPVKVSVAAGETAQVRIQVVEVDGAIQGYLVDPRQDPAPVTGVRGRVVAWNGDQWAATAIRPETGRYTLRVDPGVWHANYAIASDRYVKLGTPANLPVQAGQATTWLLPITERDSGLSGTVLTPFGTPLPGAVVVVHGLAGDIKDLRLHTLTDANGRFRIAVPHGRYRVLAPGGRPGWINPVDLHVGAPPHAVVDDLVLKFRLPNAALKGTISVKSGEAGHAVVWAWHERGGYVLARFPLEMVDDLEARGDYLLGVISGTEWHVGAIFETATQFWGVRTKVEVNGQVTEQDLVLEGPFPKPAPVAVTFLASESQRLKLADGTEIFIPAGAMPVDEDQEVTLRVVPLAGLPQQPHARLIHYGYAFFATDENGRPIEEQFNHNVAIRFPYDPPAVGRALWDIKPAYFSTTTNEWTVPVAYAVDPQAGLVKMEIDHFTNFALIKGEAKQTLFLPAIGR